MKQIILTLLFLISCVEAWSSPRDFSIPIFDQVKNLDPHQSVRTDINKIIQQIYQTLVTLDGSGYVKPYVAHSWDIDTNDKIITFKLKKNITFSDGTPLKASHIKSSLERSIKSGNQISSQINHIKAHGPFTLVIQLKNKNFSLLLKKLASQEGTILLENKKQLLGTGPFKIQSNKPDHIELVRYKNFFENGINTLRFKLVERKKRKEAFQQGIVDEMLISNRNDFPNLSEDKLIKFSYPGTLLIVLSQRSNLFKNLEERRRFSNLFKPSIWLKATNRSGKIASSLIPFGMPGHQSSSMIKSTQFKNRKLKTIKVGIIKDFFSKEGQRNITTELNRMGYQPVFVYDTFTKLLKRFRKNEVDITFKMDSAHFFDPTMLFNPYTKGSNNNIHETHDELLDKLYAKAEATLDTQEKTQILKQMENRLRELAIVVPVSYPSMYLAYSKKININKLKDLRFSYWTFDYREYVLTSKH